jgi:hypothetical protein
MGLHLEPFDPAANFKANKNFRYAGVAILKDAPIEKDRVEGRKLQLLYETHYIVVDSRETVAKLTDAEDARIAKLVEDNDRKTLNRLAADAGVADAGKFDNKGEVARAIVLAERGKPAPSTEPAPQIAVGSKVKVELDGDPLNGLTGTVEEIDGDNASIKATDAEDAEVEGIVPLANLALVVAE